MSVVSQVTSKLEFYHPSGEALFELKEWQPALLVLPLSFGTRLDNVTVELNGIELELLLKRINGKNRLFINWQRQNAGRYHLHVKTETCVLDETIVIRPRKLSEEAFEALLFDLETKLPAQIAIKIQQLGGLTGVEIMPPKLLTEDQEYLRLERAVYGTQDRIGLAKLLERISLDPYKILKRESRWLRTERLRKPQINRLVDGLKEHNLVDGLPQKMWDQRTVHSFDVYENQLLVLYLHQVYNRIRRLDRVTQRFNKELGTMQKNLVSVRRQANFLDSVKLPDYLPDQVSMVLMNNPNYQDAYKGFLELNRSLAVRYDNPMLEAPLHNLPYLYEAWGSLVVLDIFLDVAKEYGFVLKSERLFNRVHGGAFVKLLPGGSTQVVLLNPENKTIAKFIAQRTYHKSKELHSISFAQKPDMALELQANERTHIHIYDPKYKLVEDDTGDISGTPKKVDIDKMHAYKDAIRNEHNERVVDYAAIMYPGRFEAYGTGIEALSAQPSVDMNSDKLRMSIELLFSKI